MQTITKKAAALAHWITDDSKAAAFQTLGQYRTQLTNLISSLTKDIKELEENMPTLESTAELMPNHELQDAICSTASTLQESTANTSAHSLLIKQLKELLEVQMLRASQLTIGEPEEQITPQSTRTGDFLAGEKATITSVDFKSLTPKFKKGQKILVKNHNNQYAIAEAIGPETITVYIEETDETVSIDEFKEWHLLD